MSLPFFYVLDIVLISRLILTFTDTPVSRRQIVSMSVIQLAGLIVFRLTPFLLLPLGVMVLINVLMYFGEKQWESSLNGLRLISLLVQVVALGVLFSQRLTPAFSPGLQPVFHTLGQYFAPLGFDSTVIDWLKVSVTFLGLFLVVNETNILIRYIFHIAELEPKEAQASLPSSPESIDKSEYNAGRIIGILERLLVYILVLQSQYTAIGFIVAAKSFARFQDLEKRGIAEYVLIGTLLSILLALLVGRIVFQFLASH